MSDLSPEAILNNRYRIVKKLGQGGMGAVFLAYDLNLEHQVAVKVNYNPSPEGTSQFLREARLLANLRHPNLPRMVDYFIQDQDQYLVMDYIPGDDLSTRIKAQGAQPLERVMQWADELGSAIAYLHGQCPPVIHRDIKPANIKLTLEGEPILVDFGIAKTADANQANATGAVGYTPGFAPPEQYAGSARTGPYSDQYALAATLYALLSGQKPEDGVQRVLGRATLAPLNVLMPSIPIEVDQAIQKAMSIKPDDRFASVSEFLKALRGTSYQTTYPINSTTQGDATSPGAAIDNFTVPAAKVTVAKATRRGVGSVLPAAGVTQTEVRPAGQAETVHSDTQPAPARLPRHFPWLAVGLGAVGFILVALVAATLVFFLVL